MIVYDTNLFSVTNGLFRGLRVTDKRTNSTLKPHWHLSKQVSLIWVALQRHEPAPAPALKHVAQQMVYHDFGSIALHIHSAEQEAAFDLSGAEAAAYYVEQAEHHTARNRTRRTQD